MYGLKQAHFARHMKLTNDLNSVGFEELPRAPCDFRRKNEDGSSAYILVYVDDFMIFTPTLVQRSTLLEELKAMYEL